MDYTIYYLLRFLIPVVFVVGIIGIIVFFFIRRHKRNIRSGEDAGSHLQLAFSKEDAASQLFLLLSVFFLGVTLLSFNADLGSPISFQTILLVTSALALFIAYWLKTFYSLVFGLIGVLSWWGIQSATWIQKVKTVLIIQKPYAIFLGLILLVMLFYVLGRLHEKNLKWKRFALVYLVLSVIFITAILFFFSTQIGLTILGDLTLTFGSSFFNSWQISLFLIVFIVFFVGIALYTVIKKLTSIPEFIVLLFLTVLFGLIAFLPQQKMYLQTTQIYYGYDSRQLSNVGVLWAVIFNLIAFFELIGLIFLGYRRKEIWLINLGAFFLFILIIIKYFDWFFTFLDKSVFFIGAGILLFAMGWFMEKGRRTMISNIKTQSQQPIQ